MLGTVWPAAERADPSLDRAVAADAVNDAVRPGGASSAGVPGPTGSLIECLVLASDARRSLLLAAGRDDLSGELPLHDGEEIPVVIAQDEVELLDLLVRI